MDQTVATAALQLFAATALGWVWQWARSPKKFPNWASYTLFGLAGALLWFWATQDAAKLLAADWRVAIFMAVSFIQQARGGAAMSKDANAAPATNTI